MTNLSVVIPVFNGWPQTRHCLQALYDSKDAAFTVIVVDHGSTDDTKTELRRCFPQVIHLVESEALWWAGATNAGIRAALKQGADAVMMLNNDCYVEPDTISRLLKHFEHSENSIIAPIQKGIISGKEMDYRNRTAFLLGFPTLSRPGPQHLPARNLVRVQLIMGGRGAIVPLRILQNVGLLDDTLLPHYGADHDFYIRCRNQGVSLWIATDAFVLTDESRTTEAARPGELGIRAFLKTLTERRSHRNLHDLNVLFKKHYPIKGLHGLGVMLNLIRYVLFYAVQRSVFLLKKLIHRD